VGGWAEEVEGDAGLSGRGVPASSGVVWGVLLGSRQHHMAAAAAREQVSPHERERADQLAAMIVAVNLSPEPVHIEVSLAPGGQEVGVNSVSPIQPIPTVKPNKSSGQIQQSKTQTRCAV
jgi:hypothetical protein